MKHINKITLSALALPIAVVPAMVTSCNKQQTEAFEIDSKGLVTLKDKSLTTVKIPSTINDIEVHGIATNGFKDTKVESVSFEKPDQITRIEDYAFAGCTSLKAFVVPKNVSYLGIGAFSGCTSFETCNFAFGCILQTLEEKTFENTNINQITIPGSVMIMKKNLFAFSGSSNLRKVFFSNKEGWKQGDKSIQSSDMSEDKCGDNFREHRPDVTNNWGYTGITRTAKKAYPNFSHDSLTDNFYVTSQKTSISEEDKTITFDLQSKSQSSNGEYLIWVNNQDSLLLKQAIYKVEDDKKTSCSFVIDDWSYVTDGASLTIRATKKK